MLLKIKQISGLTTALANAKVLEFPFILDQNQSDGLSCLATYTGTALQFSGKVVDSTTGAPSTLTAPAVVTLNIYNDAGTLVGTTAVTIPITGLEASSPVVSLAIANGYTIAVKPAVAIQTARRLIVTLRGTR